MSNIDINDIDYFYNISSKNNNSKYNKKREEIISFIINNNKLYLSEFKNKNEDLYNKWLNIHILIFKWLNNNLNYVDNDKINCIIKAGRKYNYDFDIIINNICHKIEFKFNSKSLENIPQFLSLSIKNNSINDSYFNSSFLEDWFDNYLCNILNNYKILIPDRNIYLKQVVSINPKCCINIKKMYDEGKNNGDINSVNFYNELNELSKIHIINFILKNDILIDKINNKILETQKDKKFMLYSNEQFYYDNLTYDCLKIIKYEKMCNNYKYRCYTKNNKIIDILLRWKNGNGVAYPALQISYVKNKNNDIDYIINEFNKL